MEIDWQNKLKNLNKRTFYILEKQLFCDCEFSLSGKLIKSHKILLAASSPVFETMFFGSMVMNKSPIQVTDIEFDTFKQMIEYIYSDELKINSWKNACDIYQAAKKYMLHHLIKHCLDYLGENISTNNVLQLYEFAKFHTEDDLEKLCLVEIQINTSNVLKTDSLLYATKSTIDTILDMKRLNVTSESELISAVERWGNAEAEKKECTDVRSVSSELVQKLHFLTLTIDEFISGPVKSNLLSDKEKLEILLRILRPELPPMGTSLSEKKIRRKQRKVRCLAELNISEVHAVRCDGTEWLTSIFTTNNKIQLLGIQLNLQISDTDDYYLENLMIKVSLASEQEHFAEGGLWEMARYNSKAEILFDTFTTLEPFKEYAIHIFLCSIGVYPLGRHTNPACDNLNMEIEFVSHSSWERSQPCNMTVLSAIIFSDPLD